MPNQERAFAALHHPGFRRYYLTAVTAMTADYIEHVISYWVLWEKFASPALGGVAVLTHWLPFLLFSVYTGALADRFDARRIIQIAYVIFLAVSVGWGVLFLTDTLEVWHAVVLLTFHGLAGVLWGPASQLLIYEIVGTEHLQSAVRLNSTARQLAVLLGPAIGGGMMLALGPGWGIIANALLYLPIIVWLWKAPYATRRGKPSGSSGIAQIIDTAKSLSGNRTLTAMIVLSGATSLFVGNAFQAQMPEFAHDLGTGKADFSYTALLAANAAGGFAAGVILETAGRLQARPNIAIALTIAWSFAIAGFAITTSYPLALVLMVIAGFLNLAATAMAQTIVQLQAPSHMRGRMIGLYNMAANGLRAASGITVGVLGAVIGIHWSLALSALALLAVTIPLMGLAMRSR